MLFKNTNMWQDKARYA